jgi:hypothetical protein
MIPAVIILYVVIAFAVVVVGSLVLGRWLQRKGAALERNRYDERPRGNRDDDPQRR